MKWVAFLAIAAVGALGLAACEDTYDNGYYGYDHGYYNNGYYNNGYYDRGYYSRGYYDDRGRWHSYNNDRRYRYRDYDEDDD